MVDCVALSSDALIVKSQPPRGKGAGFSKGNGCKLVAISNDPHIPYHVQEDDDRRHNCRPVVEPPLEIIGHRSDPAEIEDGKPSQQ